jgi:hypothetical protein
VRTIALLAVLFVAGSGEPKVLRGVPLHGPTRLQLLVADVPPFVLDVDSGRIHRITGVRAGDGDVLTVTPRGSDALVWVDRMPGGADLYVVRPGTLRATRVSSSAPYPRARLAAAHTARGLTVTDTQTGARIRMPWPSPLDGADEAVAHGRFVAVGFADPAYHGGGTQAMDVWLLDRRTRRLTHVPDMLADVDLKFTSMAWAADGRLVFLAQSGGRDVVGVWRPGDRRIAVKPVHLPARHGGSDAFVPWLAP